MFFRLWVSSPSVISRELRDLNGTIWKMIRYDKCPSTGELLSRILHYVFSILPENVKIFEEYVLPPIELAENL